MHPDFPHSAVFAHRGASAYAPENTLPAFQLALDHNADGIELDVTLTADDEVVVIHDTTIDRTTNGKGAVKSMEYATISQFDAGAWFGAEFKGAHIPTLDEVLTLVGDQLFTNIEIKPFYSPMSQLVAKVAAVVSQHGLENKIIFSSFNPRALTKIHRLLPSVPIGFLLLPGKLGSLSKWLFGKSAPYASIHPQYNTVSAKMLERTRANGHKVFAYTVNQEEEMRRLFRIGIDGIITDDPVLGLNVRAEEK